jgi:hypothetical protein
MRIEILWPTFVLVGLVFVVTGMMFQQRLAHMKKNPPRESDFESGDAAMRYFQPVEMPANNYRNLFEMPVLFFALVPLLLITRHADNVQLILAWVYVLLRIVHSFVHIGPKKVQPRAMLYMASVLVLLAMWVWFAIGMLSAASMLAGT